MKNTVVGLVVVIVLVGAVILLTRGSSDEVDVVDNDTTNDTLATEGDNAVVAENQKSGADSVNVRTAHFTDGGFVVVHADADGTPGEILGASNFLSQGQNDNISVSLSRVSEDGETLYAMLHSDDGDDSFDADADPAITAENGNIVVQSFITESAMMEDDAMDEGNEENNTGEETVL